MNRQKLYVGISVASIFVGVGMLLVTLARPNFSVTYKFLILGLLIIILVANLSSYLTSYSCLKTKHYRREIFFMLVYTIINIVFIFLYATLMLLIYLAF